MPNAALLTLRQAICARLPPGGERRAWRSRGVPMLALLYIACARWPF